MDDKSAAARDDPQQPAKSSQNLLNVPVDLGGIVFDPEDDLAPLQVLGFGVYKLDDESVNGETRNREIVLVPMEGSVSVRIDGILWCVTTWVMNPGYHASKLTRETAPGFPSASKAIPMAAPMRFSHRSRVL